MRWPRRRRRPEPQVVWWDVLPCPQCNADVCFLPGQQANQCSCCGAEMRR